MALISLIKTHNNANFKPGIPSLMTDYYKILGITHKATMEQIKKAYRSKAKQYHPDINKAEDAHEQFILVNEAFEYFESLHNHKKSNRNKREQAAAMDDFWKSWQDFERQKARERARQHARMKYEAYLKSDLYRTTEAVNSVVDFIGTGFLMLLIFGVPIIAYTKHGPIALLFGLVFILPTAPLWIKFLRKTFSKEFLLSIFGWHASDIRSKIFRLMLFSIFNTIVFFKIVLNAVLTLQTIGLIYGVLLLVATAISFAARRRYYRYLIRIVVAPTLISLFFLINRVSTHTPYTETYRYTYGQYSGDKAFFTITLNNDTYQHHAGIRFFFDDTPFLSNNHITYTFATGLLGIKVVKDTELYLQL